MAAVAPRPFVPPINDVTSGHSTSDPTAWGDWSIAMATAQLNATGVGIQNVLIATDFSHQSSVALNYALNFAHRFGAHAEIVYVLPTDEYALAGPEAITAAKDAARQGCAGTEDHTAAQSGISKKTWITTSPCWKAPPPTACCNMRARRGPTSSSSAPTDAGGLGKAHSRVGGGEGIPAFACPRAYDWSSYPTAPGNLRQSQHSCSLRPDAEVPSCH